MRTAVIIIACACLIACTTVNSTKTVTFDQDSINLHPAPWTTQETTNEAGEVVWEFILPDGTYQTIGGMPVIGNLTLVVNLNDGTEQAGARTRAALEADANLNSPNATTGSDVIEQPVEPIE